MFNCDLLRGSNHQISKTIEAQLAGKKSCRHPNIVLGSTVVAACDVVAVDWTCHIHQPRRDHQGGTSATFIRHAMMEPVNNGTSLFVRRHQMHFPQRSIGRQRGVEKTRHEFFQCRVALGVGQFDRVDVVVNVE